MHNGRLVLLRACMFGSSGIGYRAGYFCLQMMTAINSMHGGNVCFCIKKMGEGIAGYRHRTPYHEGAIEQ